MNIEEIELESTFQGCTEVRVIRGKWVNLIKVPSINIEDISHGQCTRLGLVMHMALWILIGRWCKGVAALREKIWYTSSGGHLRQECHLSIGLECTQDRRGPVGSRFAPSALSPNLSLRTNISTICLPAWCEPQVNQNDEINLKLSPRRKYKVQKWHTGRCTKALNWTELASMVPLADSAQLIAHTHNEQPFNRKFYRDNV